MEHGAKKGMDAFDNEAVPTQVNLDFDFVLLVLSLSTILDLESECLIAGGGSTSLHITQKYMLHALHVRTYESTIGVLPVQEIYVWYLVNMTAAHRLHEVVRRKTSRKSRPGRSVFGVVCATLFIAKGTANI